MSTDAQSGHPRDRTQGGEQVRVQGLFDDAGPARTIQYRRVALVGLDGDMLVIK